MKLFASKKPKEVEVNPIKKIPPKSFAKPPKAVKMKKTNKNASTQSFTEIEDIREEYVILKGGNACTVMEIQSTNFALLSEEEQRVKLLNYASLLNSLSFTIQILIRSKRVDISSYIQSLGTQAANVTFDNITDVQKQKISSFILNYKKFVEDITKVNTVLDKKFYIIIPYASLEQGASSALKKEDTFEQAKASLKVKAESLMTQIKHLGLRAKRMEEGDLVELFYEFLNGQQPSPQMEQAFKSIFVQKKL